MTARSDLAALLAEPARTRAVPAHERQVLLDALAVHEGRCRLVRELLTAAIDGGDLANGSGRSDRVLTAEEAAQKLNVTRDWLARHGRRLRLVVQLNGPGSKVGYSERACDRVIASALRADS